MNIVKNTEYNNDKDRFFRKHHHNFQCETQGNSAEYYRKSYIFEDVAIWYEVMQKKYVSTEVEVNFCKVMVDIELFETEYWSSDDADSKFYYEPWNINK